MLPTSQSLVQTTPPFGHKEGLLVLHGLRQLQAGAVLQSELQVPSNQLAPLRVERFCNDDEQEDFQPDSTNDNKITIPAVLSAQASLRCENESEQSITYVTKPLDVTLECRVPETAVDTVDN